MPAGSLSRQPMQREEIERALQRLGRLLQTQGLTGEILLLGGAYMTLVLRQREATKDVDAYFVPTRRRFARQRPTSRVSGGSRLTG